MSVSAGVGESMFGLMAELFPICRSITGDGVRRTLGRLAQLIPLELHEVPTGTAVLDWEVPKEWNIREAWIAGPDGGRVVDFADHTLHVLNYSVPVHRRLSRAELDEHLFSLPDHPDRIPYRTSYYRESWGFCLPHRLRESLPEGEYEVSIDADLEPGSLTYGEAALPGEAEDEVLFSCHCCHPSLANDNLSGMVVMTELARHLAGLESRRYTYRFLFIPGTIGSITWLARNEEAAGRVRHGLVAANLGHGPFHYKRSRRGDAEIDRVVEYVLATSGEQFAEEHTVEDFVPFGYDERQYGSPGFDLPVGSLTRTPWGRYPEYHTSADDLDFVRPEVLDGSLECYLKVVEILERNRRYRNLNPKGEPQLGRRGLYRMIGGDDSGRERELALLWVLNLSDGEHDLLHIAQRSGIPFQTLAEAADALTAADLLQAL